MLDKFIACYFSSICQINNVIYHFLCCNFTWGKVRNKMPMFPQVGKPFLTFSDSSRSILPGPSSTCFCMVFFFIFLFCCSRRATIWWLTLAHLYVSPLFSVFPDSPPTSLLDLLTVISITWLKGVLECGLPVREPLKPLNTYKQLHFPPLIFSCEHNNSSGYERSYDDLNGNNMEGFEEHFQVSFPVPNSQKV